jgi:hypothetical protein
MRKRRFVHGPNLPKFLIFCKRLSGRALQKWRVLILWGEAKEDDPPMSRVVWDNLAGGRRSTRDRFIPDCMFTDPPLTSCSRTGRLVANVGE